MPAGAFHRLKDGQPLPDARLDVRGHQVVDSADRELGRVEELLVDSDQTVRLLEVEAGGILGPGRRRILLPMEAVNEIRGEVVRVNHSRRRVTGAPEHDPELMEQQHLSQLYWYYGYRSPVWDARAWYPD
jgi:hypothetical protein